MKKFSICCLAFFAGGLLAEQAVGQLRLPIGPQSTRKEPARGDAPFATPLTTFGRQSQEMFDRFFGQGGLTDVDEEALAKVEVSTEEEAKLGQQGLAEFRRQLAGRNIKLVDRGKDVEYLAKLVELVRPQMREASRYRKLQVYLAETDEVDAYTLPGGHITFSRGLLNCGQCEAGIVTVAGHELAHLDRGHLLRRTRQWKLAQQSAADPAKGFSPDKLFQSMNLMQQFFQRPFGPEEELEADRDGITWAYRLGYDPRAVELVYAGIEKGKGGAGDFMPGFFRTHPQSAERRENLQKTFAELSAAEPKSRLYLGRENLARRLTRKQREFE